MANKRNLFISDKELHLFNSINKELIQNISDQSLLYYAVSVEHTKTNFYNESIRKSVFSPVEVNARVSFAPPKQTSTNFTTDTKYALSVYFALDELYQRKLTPREGDFVEYANIVYEIASLVEDQLIYGLGDQKSMLPAECIVSRKSNFYVIGEDDK